MIDIRADGCLVRVAGVVGYQHENYRAQIRFPLDDVLDIVRDNPGGSYAVVYKRMFDEQFYTSTDYELDGAYLVWNVSSHVVAVRGELEVQIVYSTDQQIAETQIYHFTVARGLMEDEEGQGENLSDLIEQALLAAGTVDQAIYDAQQTLDEKVTAAQTAQTAAEAAQTAAERAQHTAENAKTSAAQSSNAAYNYAADANRAKRDAVTAKDNAVQAKGDAELAKTAAETAEDNANTSSLKSEGYAVGTQNGTPAGSGEPYYQDNAKYYKEQAAAAKTAAEAARDTAQQTVAGIETAGTAQVQRVTAEGATQVGNVQTKGQQVLDSIPDDYSELSGEVTNLKSALQFNTYPVPLQSASMQGVVTNGRSINVVNGKPAYTSGSAVTYIRYMECEPGDVFFINATGRNSFRLWAFTEAITSGATTARIISKSDANATIENGYVVAPEGAYFAIFNTVNETDLVSVLGKAPHNYIKDIESGLKTYIDSIPSIQMANAPMIVAGNYASLLPDISGATANRIYRINFSGGATSIPLNTPYSGSWESLTIATLISIKRDGDQWTTQYWIDNSNIYYRIILSNTSTASWNSIISASEGQTIIVVAADGSGDFTKLKDGIYRSRQYDNAVVMVKPGTYDLVSEFGSEYFANYVHTSGEPGMLLMKNVHVIFSPNSKVTCHYTGSNTEVCTYWSPFNASADGFTLENLVFEGSRTRYAVHDERSSSENFYKNHYINCNIDFDNTQNPQQNTPQAIGGGLGQNGEVIIENCVFSANAATANDGIVSYHNSGSGGRSNIVIKDSYFRGTVAGVRFGWYGSQTEKTTCIVTNCSMPVAPVLRAESASSTVQNMELLAWNNEIRSA